MSELSMGIFTGPNIFIEIALMLVFIIAFWKIFEKADK